MKKHFTVPARREWENLLSDRNLFLIVLIAPVLYLFFYGFIYQHNSITKLDIMVIDQDQSSISRLYRHYLDADPVFHVINSNDVQQAQDLLEQQKIGGYIILPQHLEATLKKGKQARLSAYSNCTSFMVSNEFTKRVYQINQTIGTGILMKNWQTKGVPNKQALKQAMPILVDIAPISNPGYGYGSFLIVGLFLLILHQLTMISIAESVAKEREKHTVTEWYQSAGNNLFRMLTNKGLPYYLLFMTYYLFVPTFPFQSFGITQQANYLELFLLGIPAFLVLTEIGLLLGSFFKTQLQALQYVALFSIPVFLQCGFSWPMEQMPLILRWFNYLLPTHFLLLPFQSMTQLGSTLQEQSGDWLVLWAQAFLYGVLLHFRYKRIIQQESILLA